MKTERPLACNMNILSAVQRERHIGLTRRLFQTVQNFQSVENGFAFSLPHGSDLVRIAEFISNERLCCPFLNFALTIEPDSRPITLLLTGPHGTQEFLREELSDVFV